MIYIDEKRKTVRLDTPGTSYVLGVVNGKYLCHLYYGKRI